MMVDDESLLVIIHEHNVWLMMNNDEPLITHGSWAMFDHGEWLAYPQACSADWFDPGRQVLP